MQASLSQQEHLSKGRVKNESALEDLTLALSESRAEAMALRARNTDLEREIAGLQRAVTARSLNTDKDYVPLTPADRASMTKEIWPMSAPLSPLSPLLLGLDESKSNRSRGSTYWRRARMCLRVASIAEYWQLQAREGAGINMCIPMSGSTQIDVNRNELSLPAPGSTSASGTIGPRVAALSRKVDVAVAEAVACTMLSLELDDTPPQGIEKLIILRRKSQNVRSSVVGAAATTAADLEIKKVLKEVH